MRLQSQYGGEMANAPRLRPRQGCAPWSTTAPPARNPPEHWFTMPRHAPHQLS
jgi:hypothetical protein